MMTDDECLLYFGFDIREAHTSPLRRLRDGLAEMTGYDAQRQRAIRAIDRELKRRLRTGFKARR